MVANWLRGPYQGDPDSICLRDTDSQARRYILKLEQKIHDLKRQKRNPTDAPNDQAQQPNSETYRLPLVAQNFDDHAFDHADLDGPFQLDADAQFRQPRREIAVAGAELQLHPSTLDDPLTSTADPGSSQSLYLCSGFSPTGSGLQSPVPLSMQEGPMSTKFLRQTNRFLGSQNHLQSIGERIKVDKLRHSSGNPKKTCIRTSDHLLPVRSTADSLLQLYWTEILPFFPFVHRPSFQERFEQLWVSNVSPPDDGFHCLLNIIFALAARMSGRISYQVREASSASYITRARELLELDVFSSGTLDTVQTWLLMAQYLQSVNEPWPCWIAVGTAMRIAQGLGFHRGGGGGPESSTMNQRDQEMARRLWHGCSLMNRSDFLPPPRCSSC